MNFIVFVEDYMIAAGQYLHKTEMRNLTASYV